MPLALPCLAACAALAGSEPAPDRHVLPGDATFPEGVTTRPGGDEFYVSSTTDGTIFRGRPDSERMSVFLPPGRDGRSTAVGLRATRDRLVVAGGPTGRIFVYDLRTRRLVRRFSTGPGTPPRLLNDVAITPSGDVFVTDSPRSLLFRIPARELVRRRAGVQPLRPFVRFPATLAPGGYANGVAPAGPRHLIVGFLQSGRLVRVDVRTRALRRVDLPSGTLPVPDGVTVRGRTAYIVNSGSRITQLALARGYGSARVVRQISDSSFRLPTTVAIAGRRLLVVNSQFDRRGEDVQPELPFTVSSVPRP